MLDREVGRIVLAGGGSPEQSLKVDQKWIEMCASSKRATSRDQVAYIPHALGKERIRSAHQWFNETYSDRLAASGLKINFIGDLNDLNISGGEKIASVYIGGGNTESLMTQLNENGTDIALKRLIRKGAILYGGSAGAIVMGESIGTAPEARNKTMQALNLITSNTLISPHYNPHSKRSHESLKKRSESNKQTIIAVPEDSGVIFDTISREYLVLGYNNVSVYSSGTRQEFAPGVSFILNKNER